MNLATLRANLIDKFLDAFLGIKTFGTIMPDDLHVDDETKRHANACMPVRYTSVRTLIEKSKALNWKDCTFLDLGCGKGRACFYAAYSGLFSKIKGIDIDARVVHEANENRNSFRFKSQTPYFEVGNATEYVLPDEKTVIFMFNPFDSYVLDRFIQNNMHRRESIAFIYSNDREAETLRKHGFQCLFANPKRQMSIWKWQLPSLGFLLAGLVLDLPIF